MRWWASAGSFSRIRSGEVYVSHSFKLYTSFLNLQTLTQILEEWQCFQPACFERTYFRPSWSTEEGLGLVFLNLEGVGQSPGGGEWLRPFLQRILDLKLNWDDFKGEMLLWGVEVGLDSFSAYLEDVRLPLAEEMHFKTSSSERQYLISPFENETCFNVLWFELEVLGLFLW